MVKGGVTNLYLASSASDGYSKSRQCTAGENIQEGKGTLRERSKCVRPPSFPLQYATVHKSEEWFMTQEDFVCQYLQLVDSSAPGDVVQLLSDVADTTKDRSDLDKSILL